MYILKQFTDTLPIKEIQNSTASVIEDAAKYGTTIKAIEDIRKGNLDSADYHYYASIDCFDGLVSLAETECSDFLRYMTFETYSDLCDDIAILFEEEGMKCSEYARIIAKAANRYIGLTGKYIVDIYWKGMLHSTMYHVLCTEAVYSFDDAFRKISVDAFTNISNMIDDRCLHEIWVSANHLTKDEDSNIYVVIPEKLLSYIYNHSQESNNKCAELTEALRDLYTCDQLFAERTYKRTLDDLFELFDKTKEEVKPNDRD